MAKILFVRIKSDLDISELAKSIPAAYESVDVRPEVFDVMFPVNPDRGPV